MITSQTKLFLLMPPQLGLIRGFASGLTSIANYVSTHSPQVIVEIVDLSGLSFSASLAKIKSLGLGDSSLSCFVGITSTTASYQSALKIANIVKQIHPEAVTFLGGHHVSADPALTLKRHSKNVDLIVVGEGEYAVSQLLKYFPDISNVPGIAYLEKGKFVQTGAAKLLSEKELDDLSLFFKNRGLVGIPGKLDNVTYVSARGCSMNCAFCAVGSDIVRSKSISAVINDIELLLLSGYTKIAIEDNFFGQSNERLKELCSALFVLKKNFPAFTWNCQSRVESLAQKEVIKLLAQAGCEAVFIGVESLCCDQLKFLNKTLNPEIYLQQLSQSVVPSLLDLGVDCFINLQFGLPNETIEQFEITKKTLKKLGTIAASKKKEITVFPQLFVVYPGTQHFREGVYKGIFQYDVFESFTAWECREQNILFWLTEHFAHGVGGLPLGVLKADQLKAGKYELDSGAVARVSTNLRVLNSIEGIKVFSYGEQIFSEKI